MDTIRRYTSKSGTLYEIDTAGDTMRYSHDEAVEALRDLGVRDAEAVVYAASQSSKPVEF